MLTLLFLTADRNLQNSQLCLSGDDGRTVYEVHINFHRLIYELISEYKSVDFSDLY